jgi:hypothetical protein
MGTVRACHTWAGFGAAGRRARGEKPGAPAQQLAGGEFPVNGKCWHAEMLRKVAASPHTPYIGPALQLHNGSGSDGCNALDSAGRPPERRGAPVQG